MRCRHFGSTHSNRWSRGPCSRRSSGACRSPGSRLALRPGSRGRSGPCRRGSTGAGAVKVPAVGSPFAHVVGTELVHVVGGVPGVLAGLEVGITCSGAQCQRPSRCCCQESQSSLVQGPKAALASESPLPWTSRDWSSVAGVRCAVCSRSVSSAGSAWTPPPHGSEVDHGSGTSSPAMER